MARFDLRAKQLALLAIVLILPIAVFAVLTTRTTLDLLQENVASEYTHFVDHVGREIDAWVDTTVRLARVVSELPLARADSGIDIAMAMRNFLDRFRRFRRFRFLEPSGGLIVEEPPSRAPLPAGYGPHLERLRDGGDLELSPARPYAGGTSPVFTVFAPCFDASGDLALVLAADVGLENLNDSLTAGTAGQTLRFALFDASGYPLIAPDDPDLLPALVAGGGQPMSEAHPRLRLVTDRRGRRYIAVERTVERTGWRLALFQEERRAFSPLHQFRRSVAFLLVAGVALTLLAGGAVASRLTRSIAKLADATRSIASGDRDITIDVVSRDELGDLADAFRRMAAEINRRKDEVEALNRALAEKVEERTRELRDREAELIQAEKLASLGQLTAGMAHEINNPLTAILGFSSMLRSRETDSGRLETLDRIIGASHRIANIILNMRQFAQPSRRMAAECDLNEIVKQALRLLENEASKHRALLELDFSRLPAASLDGNQIQQVVTNLVLNAFHAIAQTGRPGVVRLSTRRDGDDLILTVRDNGCGIPAAVLPRVFDPFFTTKSDWKGLGLGLSICYTIVANHGGRIGIESVEGSHTLVTVRLPVGEPAAKGPGLDLREMRQYAKPADGAAPPDRVLLVDDEEDIRALFQAFPGGRVTAVATGEEALAAVRERAFDLHVVDLRLEDALGHELIERMRAEGAGGRMVIITGCDPDDDLVRAARRVPGVRIIHKPFTIQDLLWEIEKES